MAALRCLRCYVLAALLAPIGFSEARRLMGRALGPSEKAPPPPPVMSLADALKKHRLKKTGGLKKLEQTSFLNQAPEKISDAQFVNSRLTGLPAIDLLADAFKAQDEGGWGAKVLLVDFFAFACTNCLRSVPHLKDLHERFYDGGLRILAFARPEFGFEGDPEEVLNWIRRNGIQYQVAIDAQSTNWQLWGVDFWPTYFIVIRNPKTGQLFIPFQHAGDRNTHKIYNQVIRHLEFPEVNTRAYIDVEFFLGKSFVYKNSGGASCNLTHAACRLDNGTKDVVDSEVPLPMPTAEDGRYTVYGTTTCRFCRRAKLLLMELHRAAAGLPEAPPSEAFSFDFVDLRRVSGGAAAAQETLQRRAGLPASHRTIPMVFKGDGTTAQFLGGYDQLKEEVRGASPEVSRLVDKEEVEAEADRAEPGLIKYDKSGSEVMVYEASKADPWSKWSQRDEALVASTDGATLTINAKVRQQPDLQDTELQATYLYIVCKPPTSGGWLVLTSQASRVDVRHSGRHYLGRYSGREVVETLRASAGLEVYVFWLTAMPHNPNVAVS